MDRAYLIGIAGPSGCGKTTLAGALARRLGSATLLALDSYYHDQSGVPEAHIEVDVPEALDHRLFVAHLRHLAAGRAIERPVYDYATHTRATRGVQIAPARYVIIEGLFTLHWEAVRALLDTLVFVDADHDTCLGRRIHRDTHERGRSEASVIEMYEAKVRPNCERYVNPSRAHADLVVSGLDPIEESVEAVVARLSLRGDP